MSYTLDAIPLGTAVMLDANIVIYALFPHSTYHLPCEQLLARGRRHELSLHLPVHAAADVIHRAMVLDAVKQGIVPQNTDVVSYLKQHPQAVQHLTRHKSILRDLTAVHINILPLSYRDLHA